jgi:hypothetical protein
MTPLPPVQHEIASSDEDDDANNEYIQVGGFDAQNESTTD